MNGVHEIAQYRVRPGTDPVRLQAILKSLHAWLTAQPGCLEIRSFLAEDGIGVTDLIAWRSKGEAQKAMAASEHQECLQALLPLVEPDSFGVNYGRQLLETRP
ncbi:MAG: hypothetical protein HY823_12365 [Acidobacteria bacterium]|nr:hypothetical protein [Acidobacteriota bacterium]